MRERTKMSKIEELIQQVDYMNQSEYCYDIEEFVEPFGYSTFNETFDWEKFEKCVAQVWLISWMCTDTMVGIKAIYLHDELVAVTVQRYRKSDMVIYFISPETKLKMKKFIESIIIRDETDYFSYINEISDDLVEKYELTQLENDKWNRKIRR